MPSLKSDSTLNNEPTNRQSTPQQPANQDDAGTAHAEKSILIIDDDPNNVEILKLDLEEEGYPLLTAANGQEGWDILQEHREDIQLILLDRMMPVMSGMEFMEKLKGDEACNTIPVIMQTAAAEKKEVVEGIEAGVYYYLTKPYDVQVMLAIVRSAIKSFSEQQQLQNDFHEFKQKLYLVKESYFEARTVEDARYLSTFLANFFPNGENVILGIAELIINGIEHGNLGITYDQKTDLHAAGSWDEEVKRLQNLPKNCEKSVIIHFERKDEESVITITDQGPGFDWEQYMQLDPARATHSHGRGIALANMISFDSVEYQGAGNVVVCRVKQKSKG